MKTIFEGYVEDYFLKPERLEFTKEAYKGTKSPNQANLRLPTLFKLNDGVYVDKNSKKIRVTIEVLGAE